MNRRFSRMCSARPPIGTTFGRHTPIQRCQIHKARNVIGQNIAASLLLAIIGLALAATGNMNIWLTPFYYALGYVFVIANSLRLVRFGEDFTEAEEARRRLEAGRVTKPTRAASIAAVKAPVTANVPA